MPSGRPATTNDIGEFRLYGLAPGEYLVSAMLRPQMIPANVAPTGDDHSGYATTYYPATPNIAEAQLLPVGMGQVLSGVTLMLVAARTSRVSGIVVDAQGQPIRQGGVMATQRGTMLALGSIGGQLTADGTFVVAGLAPGEYILRATIGMPSPNRPPETAVAHIAVNGDDLTGVRLEPLVEER
jgi:hypothetical protein